MVKSKRPRKRKTQTLAEKSVASALYKWQVLFDSYIFTPSETVSASLTERGNAWDMVLEAGGKRYVGSRATLEEAFKAIDRMLFLHARPYWLRSDASIVLESWKGVLA